MANKTATVIEKRDIIVVSVGEQGPPGPPGPPGGGGGGPVDASDVVVVPAGNLASTDAQAALEELQVDIDGRSLSGHNHTGVYSPVGHDHAGVYSPVGHDHAGVYQPLDGDLTAIAGLAGTSGFLVKTGANAWALDTTGYALAGHDHTGVYSLVGHTHAASDITSGVMATARLGGGTANSGAFLRGDNTWSNTLVASDFRLAPASGNAQFIGKSDTGTSFEAHPVSGAIGASLFLQSGAVANFFLKAYNGADIVLAGASDASLSWNGVQFADAAGLIASALASGTIPGARMPALTGDVTSAANTVATTIAARAVTVAKFQAIATASVLGRTTAGSGDVEVLTALPAVNGSALTNLNASNLASGTVPDARFPATLPALSGVNLTALNASNLGSGTTPTARLGSGTANSARFLRGDSTWSNTLVGNAGLNTSPPAWGGVVPNGFNVNHVSLAAHTNGENGYVASNLYFDGTNWRYINNGVGGVIALATSGGSSHSLFYSAPTGTAGNVATLTQVLPYHTPEFYGAKRDGATDDTTAIQSAINAAVAATGGVNTLVMKSGVYRTTTDLNADLSSGKSLRIIGEPGYASLTDSLTNASGTVIDCDFTASGKIGLHIYTTGTTTGDSAALCQFRLENFSLKFTGSATDSYGLVIGNTGYQVNGDKNSRISNVNVAGFHGDQINLLSTRYVYFDNVVATSRSSGTTTQALRIVNDNSARFTGDLTFLNCIFVGTGEANQDTVKMVATGTGAELRGARFIGCVGYYGRYCLLISAESGGKMQDVFVDFCQFDGAAATDSDTKTAVLVSASGSGSLTTGISISNSYAVQWQDYGVWVTSSSSGAVANISIDGNYIGLCELFGILVDASLGVSVMGNNLFDCCTGGTDGAITFGSAAGGLFNCVGNTHWNSSATRTAGYVVTIAEASAGTITEFTVTNNVGHAAIAAVFDNTTTGNKTVSGNWKRA